MLNNATIKWRLSFPLPVFFFSLIVSSIVSSWKSSLSCQDAPPFFCFATAYISSFFRFFSCLYGVLGNCFLIMNLVSPSFFLVFFSCLFFKLVCLHLIAFYYYLIIVWTLHWCFHKKKLIFFFQLHWMSTTSAALTTTIDTFIH